MYGRREEELNPRKKKKNNYYYKIRIHEKLSIILAPKLVSVFIFFEPLVMITYKLRSYVQQFYYGGHELLKSLQLHLT